MRGSYLQYQQHDKSRKVESTLFCLRFYITCACRCILIVDLKISALSQFSSESDHLKCNFNTLSQTKVIYTKILKLMLFSIFALQTFSFINTLFDCDFRQH